MAMKEAVLRARPLTRARYRPYGDVIEAAGRSRSANLGTARRYDFLAALKNLRPRARANLCLYRCRPRRGRLSLRLLEKHPASTQVFLPMSAGARYLLVVARGSRRPDLGTLAAFVVKGGRGISYRPGVWHHPMIALGRRTDFACLVWEDKTRRDCVEVPLDPPVDVRL